ncbi:hypothetical protein SCAR479_08992 [Seiridium cardinale]|uniref:Uncharacterized protein n=1 Tax=Seiridium cardinale TaxID=138064 RepID=A0ABR2XKP2_9PEZI
MSTVAEAPVYPVLKGKVAIITGGIQGMGRATAEVFLKAEAKVVIADVQAGKGEATATELSKFGDVTFIQTDISNSEQVQNLIAKTVEKYGRLDCAVNNAALTPDSTPLVDFDEDYWNKLVGINLTGTALCCKYEMRQMIKDGTKGSIVNIASINAFRPQPNMPAYTSSKHALIGLTKHASSEGGPKGIRVNAIAPGAISSDMSAAALEIIGVTEEEFAKGIGAAIVRDLASRGCNVIINYVAEKSTDVARELAQELERNYDVKAIPVEADISKKDQCTVITDGAQKHFADSVTGKGQSDIIVHNAGILYLVPIEDVVEDEFHKIYAVNFLASTPRWILHTTLFSGTKGALEAMARVWCRELAERATVNTINPGPVMTNMYLSAPEEVKKGLALWNPLTPPAPVLVSGSPCNLASALFGVSMLSLAVAYMNVVLLDRVGRVRLLIIGGIGSAVILRLIAALIKTYLGTDHFAGIDVTVAFYFIFGSFFASIIYEGSTIANASFFGNAIAYSASVFVALNSIGWKFYLEFVAVTFASTLVSCSTSLRRRT